jgi:hypothetical protein
MSLQRLHELAAMDPLPEDIFERLDEASADVDPEFDFIVGRVYESVRTRAGEQEIDGNVDPALT